MGTGLVLIYSHEMRSSMHELHEELARLRKQMPALIGRTVAAASTAELEAYDGRSTPPPGIGEFFSTHFFARRGSAGSGGSATSRAAAPTNAAPASARGELQRPRTSLPGPKTPPLPRRVAGSCDKALNSDDALRA